MVKFYRAGLFEMTSFRGTRLKRPGAIWLVPALLLASCAHQSQGPTASGSAPIGTNTLNVADAAIAGGDPNMALSVSQSILSTDAGNTEALEHEGDAYYALGRCPAAQAAYQLALQHDPKATEAQTGLGRCLLKTDPHAAELAFIQAVQDDPGNAAAFNDLGIARDLQGNFAGAVDPYQKALLANPALTAAEVNLGLSLALSGNGPEALQYLGPLAISQQATPKIREDYAAALVASGRDDEARQVLAVDLPPDQVNSAMAGFANLIAQSQAAPPPAAPPPTVSQVPAPMPVAAVPLQFAASAPPAPAQPMPLITAAPPAPIITPAPAPVAANAAPQHQASAPPAPMMAAVAPKPAPAPAPVPIAAPPLFSMPYSAVIAGQSPPAASAAPASASVPVVPAGAVSAQNGVSVQLAALNSQDDAQREWNSVTSAQPALFSGKQPEIEPVTVGGQTYYRLRVGGFPDKAAAAQFCGEVVAGGHPCTPANF
jgi:Flp pilus assembly protein TadD